jgi:hypothetical protein
MILKQYPGKLSLVAGAGVNASLQLLHGGKQRRCQTFGPGTETVSHLVPGDDEEHRAPILSACLRGANPDSSVTGQVSRSCE